MSDLDGFLAGSESVGSSLVDREGNIVAFNPALKRRMGAAPTFLEMIVPAQRASVSALLAEVGADWRTTQAGFVSRDGEVIDCKVWAIAQREHVLVLAEPLHVMGEKLNAALLQMNDDLLATRRELSATNARLREADELKNLFLASATHDLRTPLTSILGYAEILGQGAPPPADVRRMATTIEKNAQRLLRMINDLLGAASIMTGDLNLEQRPGDVVALIHEAIEGIQPTARAGEVTISAQVPRSAVAPIDERRLLQILDNLLSNAVKYSPDGGQVTIGCRDLGDEVVVTVSDAGVGIPASEQDDLFQRYFRASTAVDNAIEGTGLGLANARAFAEAHGGSLTCESEAGIGSTFTLVLPRRRAA